MSGEIQAEEGEMGKAGQADRVGVTENEDTSRPTEEKGCRGIGLEEPRSFPTSRNPDISSENPCRPQHAEVTSQLEVVESVELRVDATGSGLTTTSR